MGQKCSCDECSDLSTCATKTEFCAKKKIDEVTGYARRLEDTAKEHIGIYARLVGAREELLSEKNDLTETRDEKFNENDTLAVTRSFWSKANLHKSCILDWTTCSKDVELTETISAGYQAAKGAPTDINKKIIETAVDAINNYAIKDIDPLWTESKLPRSLFDQLRNGWTEIDNIQRTVADEYKKCVEKTSGGTPCSEVQPEKDRAPCIQEAWQGRLNVSTYDLGCYNTAVENTKNMFPSLKATNCRLDLSGNHELLN